MAEAFIEAKWYTPTNGRRIRKIVIHDMEAPLGPGTAENVARDFARRPPTNKASTHWNHDEDSDVRSVRDKDVAYAAPGANHDGIQHENAGYARQTRIEWLAGSSAKTLRRCAAKVALECREYNIPIRHLEAEEMRRDPDATGIVGHWDVTQAFHKSDHTDPGPRFPWDVFIDWVREAYSGKITEEEEEMKDDERTALFNIDQHSSASSQKLTDVTVELQHNTAAINRLAAALEARP